MTSVTKSRPLNAQDRADLRAQEFQERERERKEQAKHARAHGMKQRKMRAEDGSVVDVWVYPDSLAALSLSAEQESAAERFHRDWVSAHATLRAAGLEFKVDGGKPSHEQHLTRVAAQSRLDAAKRAIGARAFEIVKAFVCFGASARSLNTTGSHRHDVITAQFRLALDHLDGHYMARERKDPLWAEIERFNTQRAELIAKAEREVG